MTTKENVINQIKKTVEARDNNVKCSYGATDVRDEFGYAIHRLFVENGTLYAEGRINEHYYEMRDVYVAPRYVQKRVKMSRLYDDCGLIDLNRIPLNELEDLKDYVNQK